MLKRKFAATFELFGHFTGKIDTKEKFEKHRYGLAKNVWTTMIGVNLEGVWRLANAAVPALLERPSPRQGRFVAVSSVFDATK